MPANRSIDRLRNTPELGLHFEDAFTSIHLPPRHLGRARLARRHALHSQDPKVEGPLLRFSKDPLHRHASSASCPRIQSRRPAAFGAWEPSQPHLPSLSFLPTSTVYSAPEPASLLHLAADHGVRQVLGDDTPSHRPNLPRLAVFAFAISSRSRWWFVLTPPPESLTLPAVAEATGQ